MFSVISLDISTMKSYQKIGKLYSSKLIYLATCFYLLSCALMFTIILLSYLSYFFFCSSFYFSSLSYSDHSFQFFFLFHILLFFALELILGVSLKSFTHIYFVDQCCTLLSLDFQGTNQKSELVVWTGRFKNETGFFESLHLIAHHFHAYYLETDRSRWSTCTFWLVMEFSLRTGGGGIWPAFFWQAENALSIY